MLILMLVSCGSSVLGAEMKIAVLRDSFPARSGFADPVEVANMLEASGDAVEFVSAEHLADPNAFSAEKYWLIVLPYGSYFPALARDNFLAYLRAGGDFLSTGGYAFDEPAIQWNGQWFTLERILRTIPTREIKIGVEDDSFLTGTWHKPEPSQGEWKDQTSFKRWTGESAGMLLAVDPKMHYTMELDVSVNAYAARSKWKLSLNGKPFADLKLGHGQTLQFRLGPEQFMGRSELNIGFDGKVWRPSDVTNSPDTRLLGIAIGGLRMIPDTPAEPAPDLSPLHKPINMRHGKAGDFLEWEKEQIGVFDAGYRLSGGKSVSPAADQHIVPADFTAKGDIEGWAAAGTTGSQWYWTTKTHRSRLIPLLETTDEFGRFRGNAGALMVNTLEPYRGSIWAYFGVENRDLFSEPGADRMLVEVVKSLRRGVFMHDVYPGYACYRDGEAAVVKGSVSNLGPTPASLAVKIVVSDEAGAEVHSDTVHVELAPNETKEISSSWKPGTFGDDFYTVKAELLAGDTPVDAFRTAFYAWNKQTLANGMKLSYSNNYLRDGGKPRYMLGVEAFYDRYCPMGMDPLDIERDFRDMADMGMRISRTFTYSESEEDWRFRDALAMASARHHVAFWLSGTVFMRGYLDDPTTISIPKQISKRYEGIEGMFIDLYNEPDWHNNEDAARDARFSDYLRAKYGSDEALRAAWGDELGKDEKIGSMKMGWGKQDWLSIRSRDIYRFLLQQGSKWVTDVTGAIKSEDPSRLVSCGYLGWWNGMMMDPVITSDALDFIDRHNYVNIGDIRRFDSQLAITDRRYCGKAPSIGEFGSKTYPTFKETGHNYDTVEQQEMRYLHIGHYTYALGGIFASNWIWRDPQGWIFPYGIVHSDFTPKPVTKAYRAMSLLFSNMKPKHVDPQVYLVLPDESRFGGMCDRPTEAMMRGVRGLIDARLRFGTINEWALDKLPKSAKLLVLPSPFALSQKAYEQLREFVKSGGTLYVSGDISFDEDRKRTQTRRLQELAGVKFTAERYPDVRFDSATREDIRYDDGTVYPGCPAISLEPIEAQVIATAKDQPVAVLNSLGKGKVLFSGDPAEFWESAPLGSIYLRAASEAGVRAESVSPELPGIQVFRMPCEGGEAVMVGNVGEKPARVSVTAGGKVYSVLVAPERQAMLITSGGKLVGAEAQGDVKRGGVTLVSAKQHFFAVSLDRADLAASQQIALVGLKAGRYLIGKAAQSAEIGEVRGGKWHVLKSLIGGVSVPESLAGDIVLISSKDAMAKARQSVASLLAR